MDDAYYYKHFTNCGTQFLCKTKLYHIATLPYCKNTDTTIPVFSGIEQVSFCQKHSGVLGCWSGFRDISPVVSREFFFLHKQNAFT